MSILATNLSMFIVRSCPVLFLCLLLAGCGNETSVADTQLAETASRVNTYESKGVVKTITPSRQYINIDHEEIIDFMDAMTMMFAVKDTSLLSNISVEDSIAFKIEVATSMPQIVEIQRLSQD